MRPDLYIAYIDDKDLLREIKIRSLPDNIGYSKESLYKEQTLLGRLSPIYTYERGSEEFYTFEVLLHEDDLIDTTKTLKDFVDDILKVNYPFGLGNVSQQVKRPYFEIGALKGEGIIDVQVAWNTPFREGKYIYATLSFTITVLEDFSNTIKEIYRETDFVDEHGVVIKKIDKMYTTATTDFTDLTKAHSEVRRLVNKGNLKQLYTQGTGDLQDFITGTIPTDVKHKLYENAINKFDNNRQRLQLILDKLKSTEYITDEHKKAIEKVQQEIHSVNYKTVEIKRTVTDSWSKEVEKAIKEYYTNNRNLLPEERDMLIKEIDFMFREMRFLQEAVLQYGAAS